MATALRIGVLALVLVGLAARLSPFLEPGERLFWQYMTEDGYLMQTVARNMAIGLGMSIAEGTIPTNGVQPLATFVFAGLHVLSGGSKLGGIALVVGFSSLVALAAGYYAYRLMDRLFAGLAHGRELALAAAAAWFAAPHIVAHSMNGLETGLYFLAIAFVLHWYLGAVSEPLQALSWRQRLALGALLGLLFLVRNDGAFLIGALLLAHLAVGGAQAGGGVRHRFLDCLIAGVVSIVVASPWLAYNHALFGSIVPISGTAQSLTASFGQNLALIPANLFEVAFLYLPIPRALEARGLVMLACAAALAALLTLYWRSARLTLAGRRFFVAGLAFTSAMAAFYGLYFGADWFLPRYLSALSLFLWPATAAVSLLVLGLLLREPRRLQAGAAATVAALALGASAFAAGDYRRGTTHMHRQVVEWVQANLPASECVGAPQTGTLGYFHDRTINLDGKVNPRALRARLEEEHIEHYVLRSRINYVVDWVGMAGWVEQRYVPQFAEAFEVLVKDEARNLAVLRRTRPVGSAGDCG